jgi:hypothetical protein
VVWGYIPPGRKPVLTVRPGQIVRIDTLSHQPISGGANPMDFFKAAGFGAHRVLEEVLAVFQKVQRPKDAGAHVLTGPIYVEGAEPGDMLEVRILHIDFRLPYGVNNSNKGSGALPALHSKPAPKVIPFDLDRSVALFAPGIEVPLNPFMGIMIVTPPEGRMVSTRPPGIYGGNLDMARLTAGASLYLPVFQPGALHRRRACRAGRRGSERYSDRDFAHARAPIHRSQGRRQIDEMAASRGRGELLRHGHGRRSERRDERSHPGVGEFPPARAQPVSGGCLRSFEHRDEFRHLRDRQSRARDLRRHSEEAVQYQSAVLVRAFTVTRRPACGST